MEVHDRAAAQRFGENRRGARRLRGYPVEESALFRGALRERPADGSIGGEGRGNAAAAGGAGGGGERDEGEGGEGRPFDNGADAVPPQERGGGSAELRRAGDGGSLRFPPLFLQRRHLQLAG